MLVCVVGVIGGRRVTEVLTVCRTESRDVLEPPAAENVLLAPVRFFRLRGRCCRCGNFSSWLKV